MFNIAIDGPSASGKSTIAKALSKRLGLTHIDTGSMYRAVALQCIKNNVSLDNHDACLNVVQSMKLDIIDGKIFVEDVDVSEAIRVDSVSQAASRISQHAGVRAVLVDKQREIASRKGFVLDGRDITSVVLPDAEVKIYQTADVVIRANRRYEELIKRGLEANYEDVLSDLESRDFRDMNRKESPLVKVVDAYEIDTSSKTIDEIVVEIMKYIESRNLI